MTDFENSGRQESENYSWSFDCRHFPQRTENELSKSMKPSGKICEKIDAMDVMQQIETPKSRNFQSVNYRVLMIFCHRFGFSNGIIECA